MAENKEYKDTLNLPATDFPMKANLPLREPERLRKWEAERVYEKALAARKGRPVWTLHDGPPYANGHIHMGHALNKVLKDIVVKSRWMSGFYSHYVPGWDCHGLPIEHKVDEELSARKKGLPALEVRQACRRYAGRYIDIQREEFKRLGVFGDWEHPYITMDFPYEARITRELGAFVGNGSVYRKKKPVHWCSTCATALAEAEVEYADVSSPSIFVRFPFTEELGGRVAALAGKKAAAVIWTTTPWTIPANLAVALHPDYEYGAYEKDGELLILAVELAERAFAEMGLPLPRRVAVFPGRALEGARARHPLYDRPSVAVLAPYVTLDAGTGIVHTAPGHGQEDYETGLRYGLEVLSVVDDHGRFTADAPPFTGKKVKEGNPLVVEALREAGALLASGAVGHSYPHCWRCKSPILFRATEQWFISMEKNHLRDRALEEIKKVAWIPAWGRERIYGMVENRPDWCISRQRVWGSPLTAFFCEQCEQPLITKELCDHVAGIMETEGADVWYAREAADLLPPGTKCPSCGGTHFRKDMNILDVWFDSGVSQAAVLDARPDLPWPCDLYLEGSDQHRGWFHSSLLAAVGVKGKAPYREVLTHGYVVDGQGRKMSKSLGNVISPLDLMKEYGADIVRLWVASTDYSDDIRVSKEILARTADAYRKVRNTLRFLLGNLSGFDPGTDAVPREEMEELDRWALARLSRLDRQVRAAYEGYQFHLVYRGLYDFCVVDLSNFYLDVLKDRLYASAPQSRLRRSAQTALYRIARDLTLLMSPILPFTSEEVWEGLPGYQGGSVFEGEFPAQAGAQGDDALEARYEGLLRVREAVTKALETERQAKTIGTSLEARVVVRCPDADTRALLDGFGPAALADLFIVSGVEVVPGNGGTEVMVQVVPAHGTKCARCWRYDPGVGTLPARPAICPRCAEALAEAGR